MNDGRGENNGCARNSGTTAPIRPTANSTIVISHQKVPF